MRIHFCRPVLTLILLNCLTSLMAAEAATQYSLMLRALQNENAALSDGVKRSDLQLAVSLIDHAELNPTSSPLWAPFLEGSDPAVYSIMTITLGKLLADRPMMYKTVLEPLDADRVFTIVSFMRQEISAEDRMPWIPVFAFAIEKTLANIENGNKTNRLAKQILEYGAMMGPIAKQIDLSVQLKRLYTAMVTTPEPVPISSGFSTSAVFSFGAQAHAFLRDSYQDLANPFLIREHNRLFSTYLSDDELKPLMAAKYTSLYRALMEFTNYISPEERAKIQQIVLEATTSRSEPSSE